jgi:hypothetical protein
VPTLGLVEELQRHGEMSHKILTGRMFFRERRDVARRQGRGDLRGLPSFMSFLKTIRKE